LHLNRALPSELAGSGQFDGARCCSMTVRSWLDANTFQRHLRLLGLKVGQSASLLRIVGRDDIDLFAAVSGDVNPAHLDATFAATDLFGHVVAHGMWTAALVSTLLGTKLPGPGTIYLGQDLRFIKPVAPGDTITVTVTVKEKRPEKHIVLLDTTCTNQNGGKVLSGTATVIAPTNKIEWPRSKVPTVKLRRQDRYEAFVKAARSLPILRAAIVHPCSTEAILGALEVQREGLLEPLLIGPEQKIRAAGWAGVTLPRSREGTFKCSLGRLRCLLDTVRWFTGGGYRCARACPIRTCARGAREGGRSLSAARSASPLLTMQLRVSGLLISARTSPCFGPHRASRLESSLLQADALPQCSSLA